MGGLLGGGGFDARKRERKREMEKESTHERERERARESEREREREREYYFHNLCKMRGYINRCSGCCDLKPEETDTSFRNDSGPALRAAKGDYSKVYAKGTAHPPNPTKPVHSRGVSFGTLQKLLTFMYFYFVLVSKCIPRT